MLRRHRVHCIKTTVVSCDIGYSERCSLVDALHCVLIAIQMLVVKTRLDFRRVAISQRRTLPVEGVHNVACATL